MPGRKVDAMMRCHAFFLRFETAPQIFFPVYDPTGTVQFFAEHGWIQGFNCSLYVAVTHA
jgi:hypothetical protein